MDTFINTFVEFVTQPVTFITISVLGIIIINILILVGLRLRKMKGKTFNFTLMEGERFSFDLPRHVVLEAKISSTKSFTLLKDNVETFVSDSFNNKSHTREINIFGNSSYQIKKGYGVYFEIKTSEKTSLVIHPSKLTKWTLCLGALAITIIYIVMGTKIYSFL